MKKLADDPEAGAVFSTPPRTKEFQNKAFQKTSKSDHFLKQKKNDSQNCRCFFSATRNSPR